MRWFGVVCAGLGSGCLLPNPAFSDGSGSATGGTAGGATAGTSTQGSAGTSVGAGTETGTDSGASAGAAAAEGPSGESGGVTSGGSSSGGCAEVDQYIDADGDGFGVGPAVLVCPGSPGFAPQDGDCDDGDPLVSPGAIEICDPDRVDEDCDGLINEASANNPACEGCALEAFGGHAYWFCPIALPWDAARGVCQGFGAVDLVIVDEGPENAFVYERLPDVDVWLGARDLDPNQIAYTWVDGSPLGYTHWGGPDPNHDGGCLVMAGDDMSRWADRGCEIGYFFACESKG